MRARIETLARRYAMRDARALWLEALARTRLHPISLLSAGALALACAFAGIVTGQFLFALGFHP